MTTLSEITQRYIKHRDLADTKEAMGQNSLFDLMVRNIEAKGSSTLRSRWLGKTEIMTALMEREMERSLEASRRLCGCLKTDHLAFECPKQSVAENAAQRARAAAHIQIYSAHPLLKAMLDGAKGKEVGTVITARYPEDATLEQRAEAAMENFTPYCPNCDQPHNRSFACVGDEPRLSELSAMEPMFNGMSKEAIRASAIRRYGADAPFLESAISSAIASQNQDPMKDHNPVLQRSGGIAVWGVDTASGPDSSVWFQTQPDGSLRQIPEVRVTDNMRSVGFKVGIQHQPTAPLLVETLDAIYRAMHSVAPVPLVTEAEDKIAALQSDIACLRRLRHDDDVRLLREAEIKHTLIARLEKSEDENAILRQRLAQHGESVTFMADPPSTHTAGDMKPEPVREPKPIPAGALQPTTTDRRRIGG